MEIKGYTLHGDYYLADNIIPNKNWKEACEIKEEIILPNGKTIIAHTLSKEELKSIPLEERMCKLWYWTSTSDDDNSALYVKWYGEFQYNYNISVLDCYGGARLGFKNPF